MRRAVVLALPFALSLIPAMSFAADQPAFKIGYVDMNSALNLIDEGKKEKDKLKKDFDAKQKKLDAMQEDLKKLKDDFDKQAAMLKEDARARKQQELQQKFMDLQQNYMAMQKDLTDREAKVRDTIFGKMRTIIEKIGDRDNYTLIMDRNEGNVLYFKRHMDITDEVVKTYNAQNKPT
jgi:outer membrane protein